MSGIVYPKNWKNITKENPIFSQKKNHKKEENLIKLIKDSLIQIKNEYSGVFLLFLSGGIDSSIIATIATHINLPLHTTTISSRANHPDQIHAQILVQHLNLSHTSIIIEPPQSKTDMYEIVFRTAHQLGYTHSINCDCIDELLGGYWQHQNADIFCKNKNYDSSQPRLATYKHFWNHLAPNHLNILNKFAKQHGISSYQPYLNKDIVKYCTNLPFSHRTDKSTRKIPLRKIAKILNIPKKIITRPKLGLVDCLK